jgi:drug/metabolite transporter (DMT)-like permease
MFILLWIPATIVAAAFQVARNALQRGLLPRSGPWAATLVRFLFGLPFSYAFAAVVFASSPGATMHLSPTFWTVAMTGAATQVLATAALLVAMRRAGFAVATAMQQSSLPLAAIIGLVVFRDQLSHASWTGVAVTTAGLLALSWPRRGGPAMLNAGGPKPISGGAFGALSGLLFG